MCTYAIVVLSPVHSFIMHCCYNTAHICSQNLVPGVLPKPELEWDYNLGDILLGMSVISDECTSDGMRLVDRLPVIVTHGLCHLIGYRHGDDVQWNKVCP